jgi:hypothetical protein
MANRMIPTRDLAEQFMVYGVLDLYVAVYESKFIRHQNFWLMQGCEKIGKGLLMMLTHPVAQLSESQINGWLKRYSHKLKNIITEIDILTSGSLWLDLGTKTTSFGSFTVSGQKVVELFSKQAFSDSRYPSLDKILKQYPIQGFPDQYWNLMGDTFLIDIVKIITNELFKIIRTNYHGQFTSVKRLNTNRIKQQEWTNFLNQFVGTQPL